MDAVLLDFARIVPKDSEKFLRFDMLIVCHVHEIANLRRLLCQVRSVMVLNEYRALHYCCIDYPNCGLFIVKNAKVWWCGLKFEER